jgi:hypothetical protein
LASFVSNRLGCFIEYSLHAYLSPSRWRGSLGRTKQPSIEVKVL